MDLNTDTMVTILVDLNTGWYAHDFLCAYPRGDGLGRLGGKIRQLKTRISGEATYHGEIIGFHH